MGVCRVRCDGCTRVLERGKKRGQRAKEEEGRKGRKRERESERDTSCEILHIDRDGCRSEGLLTSGEEVVHEETVAHDGVFEGGLREDLSQCCLLRIQFFEEMRIPLQARENKYTKHYIKKREGERERGEGNTFQYHEPTHLG